MVTPLEEAFPGLAKGGYRVTSPRASRYNCIAWAAGETRDWWWPGRNEEQEYWPPGVPRERTRDAFVAVFASLGYTVCEGESPEAGYEKIALFTLWHGLLTVPPHPQRVARSPDRATPPDRRSPFSPNHSLSFAPRCGTVTRCGTVS